jgi:hypothetical protein
VERNVEVENPVDLVVEFDRVTHHKTVENFTLSGVRRFFLIEKRVIVIEYWNCLNKFATRPSAAEFDRIEGLQLYAKRVLRSVYFELVDFHEVGLDVKKNVALRDQLEIGIIRL